MAVERFTSAITVTARSSVRRLDRALIAPGTRREASLRRARGTSEARPSAAILASATIASNEVITHLPDVACRRSVERLSVSIVTARGRLLQIAKPR